jgi:hypothetical protein
MGKPESSYLGVEVQGKTASADTSETARTIVTSCFTSPSSPIYSFDKPLTSQEIYHMEQTPDAPDESWRKRMRGKLSGFKSKLKNRDHPQHQSTGSTSIIAGHLDRPVSAPPNIPQELSQHTNAPSAVSVDLVPSSTSGTREVHTSPPSKSSPAVQTTKFIGKVILGLLSSAAEGVPVPGVKGIFDTIIKVIGVIEASGVDWVGVVY